MACRTRAEGELVGFGAAGGDACVYHAGLGGKCPSPAWERKRTTTDVVLTWVFCNTALPDGPSGGKRPRGKRLLGPDDLAVFGLTCAPALGELGDEQQPPAALVVSAGPA